MSLRYSPTPLGDDLAAAAEEHDERLRDLQHAACDQQGPNGPCGRCEPCRLVRRAVEYHGDPHADLMGDEPDNAVALHVIGALARDVAGERRLRLRAEQDASYSRGRADRLEIALELMETRAEKAEKSASYWQRECYAAQEDGEAA